MKDHYCRSCYFRFIPVFWDIVCNSFMAKCSNCGSNATEEVDESKVYPPYEPPKNAYRNYIYYPCVF